MQYDAVSGPTHDQQPVFQWSTAPVSVSTTPHVGQPDRKSSFLPPIPSSHRRPQIE
jgi:hypothetical protein